MLCILSYTYTVARKFNSLQSKSIEMFEDSIDIKEEILEDFIEYEAEKASSPLIDTEENSRLAVIGYKENVHTQSCAESLKFTTSVKQEDISSQSQLKPTTKCDTGHHFIPMQGWQQEPEFTQQVKTEPKEYCSGETQEAPVFPPAWQQQHSAPSQDPLALKKEEVELGTRAAGKRESELPTLQLGTGALEERETELPTLQVNCLPSTKPCCVLLDPTEVASYFSAETRQHKYSPRHKHSSSSRGINIWVVPYKREKITSFSSQDQEGDGGLGSLREACCHDNHLPDVNTSVSVEMKATETSPEIPLSSRRNSSRPRNNSVAQSIKKNLPSKIYQCSICSKQFTCPHRLRRHLGTHSDVRPFSCHACKNSYKTKEYLKVHVALKHTKNKRYKCKKCVRFFINSTRLNDHVSFRHHNILKFQCDHCNKTFGTRPGQQNHFKYCPNSPNQQILQSDGQKNKFLPRPTCQVCNKSFGEKISLQRHVSAVHLKERNYRCSECEGRFFMERDLKRHFAVVHKKEKPYECGKCKRLFGRKDRLNEHMQSIHNGKNKCGICDKYFSEKGSLQRHVKQVHLAEKKHRCDQCDACFHLPYLLREHVVAKHRNERIYQCPQCDKNYKYKKDLYAHKLRCHKNQAKVHTHKCGICNASFHYIRNFYRHQENIHTKYFCDLCNKNCVGKKSLVLHMKNKHGLF